MNESTPLSMLNVEMTKSNDKETVAKSLDMNVVINTQFSGFQLYKTVVTYDSFIQNKL